MIAVDNHPDLTCVVGPMFSGKSSELVDQLHVAQEILGLKVLLVKPSMDIRYAQEHVVTHSGRMLECKNADTTSPDQIIAHIIESEKDGLPVEIVGIDEVQFFDKDGVIAVVNELLAYDKRVIVAGLPTDFRDKPFGATPDLLSLANIRIVKSARCLYGHSNGRRCGNQADKTQRIIDGEPALWNSPVVMLGAAEAYEARCGPHHRVSVMTSKGLISTNPHNIIQRGSDFVVINKGKELQVLEKD